MEVPSEGEADAGVVTYRFKPYPGRLELSLRNLSGRPVQPKVCLYPAGPSQLLVASSANVQNCP